MASKQKVCLLAIDPQNDFVGRNGGSLVVANAIDDMDRLSKMIDKNGPDIDDIQITLDSHYHYHIAHSCFFLDKMGNHPKPFTVILEDSIKNGDFRATNPEHQDWAKYYVSQLGAMKKFALVIWPDHTIIGSLGQCIDPVFYAAITEWETKYFAMAPRTTKGSNPFTEHYGAVKAEVEHPDDPKTRLNTRLIDTLKAYDILLLSGEALSHCVATTIRQIADEFSDDQIKKFVLLEDACSNVTSFEKQGEDFVNEMIGRGMKIAKTTTFFK
jgi:nicotinamidase/pyrazinamidase